TILISERLVRCLNADELRAVVAHEQAHHARRDNIKRLAFACIPVVWSRSLLDEGARSWQNTSERTADAIATYGKPDVAVALASAIVKTCRLIEARHIDAPVICSALVHGTPVHDRVLALLAGNSTRTTTNFVWYTAGAVVIVTSALYGSGLAAVHRAS